MSNLPEPLQKIAANEDAKLAILVAWFVGVPVCALAGFYLMTIVGSDHIIDLQLPDIVRGGSGAIGGLLAGIVVASVVTAVYPNAVLAEEARTPHESAHTNPTEP